MDDATRNSREPRKVQLEILFLDDDAADIELCVGTLENGDLNFHCDPVHTLQEFTERLSAQSYDVVLADYSLKGCTGLDALALLRAKRLDIPFILVSGVIGEDKAVECIKNGVDDFILKDRLARLPLAIQRSLERRKIRAAQERAESTLRESEERFRTLAEASASAILVYQGTDCRYANRTAELITGYTREELATISSWELLHPDSRETIFEYALERSQGTCGPQRFDVKILRKDGKIKWLDLTIGGVDLDGSPAGLLTGLDITERKMIEVETLLQVSTDPLTELANYRRLQQGFKAEMERSRRTGRTFAFALFDLDRLKRINDNYGHLVGSRALCRLAHLLRTQCRNIDLVARYGGDEFAVLLPETNAEGAGQLIRRICHRLSIDTEHPRISVSGGVSVFPTDGESMEALFEAADNILYDAKRQFAAASAS
jgi:diguanylate cyclase (GGDEF)-like protein/PAS domain S-box-containing protein